MPTYDYKCRDCDFAFERFHAMTADPIKLCPECDNTNVKRLIGTGGGILFRGSGFFETDYRSKDYKAKEKAGKESEAPVTKKTPDSKPSKEE